MALSIAERRQLLELELPASNEARKQVQDYMARTQLTAPDLAMRIGYSTVSVRMWLRGEYEGVASHDTAIRAKLMEFINAHPIGSDKDDTDGTLYETANVHLLKKYFYQALNFQRAYYVHGDPGCQKTFVLTHLQQELNRSEVAKGADGRRAFLVYCRGGIRPMSLMKRVAEAAGIPVGGDIERLIRNLRFEYRGRKCVLVFDEAQHLDVECLEVVRELFDRPPHFGLLFAGSHELERIFVRHSLSLEQWMSRFHAGKNLPGISETEAWNIVDAEIGSLLRGVHPAKEAERRMRELIKKSYARTLHKETAHEYISARRLFWAIREIKQAFTAKGGEA